MFKKFAIAAPLALLALGSSGAFAAGEAAHSISVIAHVPTNGFYVVPTDPDLVNKDQDMSFRPSTGKMGEVNGFFDIRNNNGSVHASVDSTPKLISGASSADLKVTLNNVELSTTPQPVNIEATFQPDPSHPQKNQFKNQTPSEGFCQQIPQACEPSGLFSLIARIPFTANAPILANHVDPRRGGMAKVPSDWRDVVVTHASGDTSKVQIRIAGIGHETAFPLSVGEMTGGGGGMIYGKVAAGLLLRRRVRAWDGPRQDPMATTVSGKSPRAPGFAARRRNSTSLWPCDISILSMPMNCARPIR